MFQRIDRPLEVIANVPSVARAKNVNIICAPILLLLIVNFSIPAPRLLKETIGIVLIALMVVLSLRFFVLGARWDAKERSRREETFL